MTKQKIYEEIMRLILLEACDLSDKEQDELYILLIKDISKQITRNNNPPNYPHFL